MAPASEHPPHASTSTQSLRAAARSQRQSHREERKGVLRRVLRLSGAALAIVSLALPGCKPAPPREQPQILLFNGTGTTPNGVAAIETILKARRLGYDTASSEQLNRMGEGRLRAYRLLIVPGGNYITMGENLTTNATMSVRAAVQGGLNYLGICAGGILAGDAPGKNFGLTAGVRFSFYSVVNQGVHKTNVAIAAVDGTIVEHYWEDGPQFTGWGAVVGNYPDGTPAMVEGASGRGWVVLSGVHPEAPETWRRGMKFSMPARVANAQGAELIQAALNGSQLPHH